MLQQAKCLNNRLYIPCITLDFDNKDYKLQMQNTVRYFTTESGRQTSQLKWPALSKLRSEMITSLVGEIKNYFPDGSLNLFDAIDPQQLPNDEASVSAYVECITNLAKRFSYDITIVTKQFKELLISPMQNDKEKYCILRRNGNAVDFWVHYINSNLVVFVSELKNLILDSLTIPVGSADIEHGFSTMNYIKSKG